MPFNEDGTKWIPKDNPKICSKHFVSGKPSSEKENVDFVPTIFETKSEFLTGPLPVKFDQYEKRRHELHPLKDSTGNKFSETIFFVAYISIFCHCQLSRLYPRKFLVQRLFLEIQ